jgi:hypothetical protein
MRAVLDRSVSFPRLDMMIPPVFLYVREVSAWLFFCHAIAFAMGLNFVGGILG